MRKITKILTTLGLVFGLSSCSVVSEIAEKLAAKKETTNELGTATSFVSLDINPSLKFVLDENGLVIGLYSDNDEGSYIAYSLDDLTGLDIAEAIEKVKEAAYALGYLTEENNTINITGSNLTDELLEKIEASATVTIPGSNIQINMTKEQIFSVLKEYTTYLTENDLTEEDLSYEKFELALSNLQLNGTAISATISMSDEDLIALISEAVEEGNVYINDTYEEIIKESELALKYQEVIEEGKAMIEDMIGSIDASYFTSLISEYASDPTDYTKLGEITKLSKEYGFNVARTVNGLLSLTQEVVFEEIDEIIENWSISEAEFTTLLDELHLEEIEVDDFMDEEGNITIDSIESKLDKYFRKHKDYEDRRNMRKIWAFIDEIENDIYEEIDSHYFNDYIELFSGALSTMKTTLTTFKGYVEDAKTNISDLLSSLGLDVSTPFGRGFHSTIGSTATKYLDDGIDVIEDVIDIIEELEEYGQEENTLTYVEILWLVEDCKDVVRELKSELNKLAIDIEYYVKKAEQKAQENTVEQQKEFKKARKKAREESVKDPKFEEAKNTYKEYKSHH